MQNIYNDNGLTRIYFGRWALGLDWMQEPGLITLWLFTPRGEHPLDIRVRRNREI